MRGSSPAEPEEQEDPEEPFRLLINGVRTDVEARVAACTPQPGARRAYGIGLEFTSIADADRETLRQVLAAS